MPFSPIVFEFPPTPDFAQMPSPTPPHVVYARIDQAMKESRAGVGYVPHPHTDDSVPFPHTPGGGCKSMLNTTIDRLISILML
jgi:hypothetical protein